jgi:hypothetical protein
VTNHGRRGTAWLGALPVLTLLMVAGAAMAIWSTQGTGSGAGSTGSTLAVILTPGTPTTDLYPGGRADVQLTITNPNPTAVRIDAIGLDTAQGTEGYNLDAAHSACGVATLYFDDQDNAGAGWTIPGRAGGPGGTDGALHVTLPEPLNLGREALNSCQDAIITVHLKSRT